MNRIDDLVRRIRLGEDSCLEFKSVVVVGKRVKEPSRRTFADELAAFANTRGGTIVLGVDDKTRQVVGIPLGELDVVEGWVRGICNDSVEPALDADIYKLELEGADGRVVPVIRIEIPRSLFVHQSPGGYYRRLGSSKRKMAPEVLARMIQERSQREPFAEALEAEGIRYVFLGNELGGRSENPACYEDGRIRYERVAATESFKSGLARVVQGTAKHRIALMCAEKEPLHCHRTLLVARALDAQGADVAHIHADGRLEPHGEAMDRLLDLHNLSREGDLSGTREELIDTAIAHQAQRIAHTDDKLVPRPSEHDA